MQACPLMSYSPFRVNVRLESPGLGECLVSLSYRFLDLFRAWAGRLGLDAWALKLRTGPNDCGYSQKDLLNPPIIYALRPKLQNAKPNCSKPMNSGLLSARVGLKNHEELGGEAYEGLVYVAFDGSDSSRRRGDRSTRSLRERSGELLPGGDCRVLGHFGVWVNGTPPRLRAG